MAVASGGIGFGVAWQLGQSQAAALRKALIASTAAEQAHKALATQGQLNSFKHRGFWQPMDTLRDRQRLEDLWQQGRAPWKVWS